MKIAIAGTGYVGLFKFSLIINKITNLDKCKISF